MAAPCSKCGATKTENAPRDLLYKVAKIFDYRVRLCSRCRRRRFLPRHPENTNGTGADSARAAELLDASSQKEMKPVGCPRCGKVDYRRSRRHIWERLFGRGPMVRCRACRARFPRPEDAAAQHSH